MTPPIGSARSGIVAGAGSGSGLVDNLEDSPDGPYASGESLSTYYNGDTGQFDRTTTAAAEGSQACATTGTNTFGFIYSQPGDGLPNYPGEGDTVACLQRQPSGNPGSALLTNATNDGNGVDGYGFEPNAVAGEIRIDRWDDGGATILASTSVTLSADTWYWGEVSLGASGDGSMTYTLYEADASASPPTKGSELASVTTTDTNYVTDRGIGTLRASSDGTGTIIDWIRVL